MFAAFREQMPGNMAFRNSFSGKLDDFVGPSPQSPPSESPFSAFPSPQGSQKGFVHSINAQPSTSEVRSTMQRRFTTESAVLPQWNGFNQQPLKQTEQLDILSSVSLNTRFVLSLGWRDRDVKSKVKLNIRLSSL